MRDSYNLWCGVMSWCPILMVRGFSNQRVRGILVHLIHVRVSQSKRWPKKCVRVRARGCKKPSKGFHVRGMCVRGSRGDLFSGEAAGKLRGWVHLSSSLCTWNGCGENDYAPGMEVRGFLLAGWCPCGALVVPFARKMKWCEVPLCSWCGE